MSEVITTLPENVVKGKKGRPATFTPEKQAEVSALTPGQYIVLQEGVRGRSRLTNLRSAHPEFTFEARNTGVAETTGGKSVEVVTIYVGPKAVAVPESAPAPKGRKAPAKA